MQQKIRHVAIVMDRVQSMAGPGQVIKDTDAGNVTVVLLLIIPSLPAIGILTVRTQS